MIPSFLCSLPGNKINVDNLDPGLQASCIAQNFSEKLALAQEDGEIMRCIEFDIYFNVDRNTRIFIRG